VAHVKRAPDRSTRLLAASCFAPGSVPGRRPSRPSALVERHPAEKSTLPHAYDGRLVAGRAALPFDAATVPEPGRLGRGPHNTTAGRLSLFATTNLGSLLGSLTVDVTNIFCLGSTVPSC
jgi:hypothetical protein